MMGPVSEIESGCAGGSKFNLLRVVSAAGNHNGVSPRRMTMTDAASQTLDISSDHDVATHNPVVCETRPATAL
jgi:hypothetical protein